MSVQPARGGVPVPRNLADLLRSRKCITSVLQGRDRAESGDGYQWDLVLADDQRQAVAQCKLFSNGQAIVHNPENPEEIYFISDCQVRDRS